MRQCDEPPLTRALGPSRPGPHEMPLNSVAWYELGRYDQEVVGDDVAAEKELKRAIELDPHGCPARRALGQACGD
jgi:hypothetical protein